MALKQLYKRGPIAQCKTIEDLQRYVEQELEVIEQAVLNALPREIDWLHVEPTKVREGLTVGADGTDWNPGAGEGVYTYYAAAWHKLG